MYIKAPTIPSWWCRCSHKVWESERDLWTKEISSNSGALEIWKFSFNIFLPNNAAANRFFYFFFMEINMIKNKIKIFGHQTFGWTREGMCLQRYEYWHIHFMTFQDFFYTNTHKNGWINFYYSFAYNNGKGHKKKKSYWLMIMAIPKRLPFIV